MEQPMNFGKIREEILRMRDDFFPSAQIEGCLNALILEQHKRLRLGAELRCAHFPQSLIEQAIIWRVCAGLAGSFAGLENPQAVAIFQRMKAEWTALFDAEQEGRVWDASG